MNDKDRLEPRSSLRDLAYVFFRRKWVILGVLLATVVPSTLYTLQLPNVYETTARLLIKPGRENIYVSPVGAPEGTHPPTIVQRVREVINSEIEILTSRILLARVIDDLGIDRFIPGIDAPNGELSEQEKPSHVNKAVDTVLPKLTAKSVVETDVIEIAFKSSDPKLSFDFVNKWIDRFLERHVEVHQSGQSFGFFKEQADQLQQALITSARRQADFEKKYSIVSFDEQKNMVLSKYMEVDAEKKTTVANLKGAEKKIEKLKTEMAGLSKQGYEGKSEISDSDATNMMKTRLAELELERAELLNRYKPDNYHVVRINDSIAQIKKILADEKEQFHGSIATGKNQNYQKAESDLLVLETDIASYQAKLEELDKQLLEYGAELERLGRLEPELRSLKRNVATNEQTYRLYLTKFEESRVSEAMDAAKMVSVSVIEPAQFPARPLPVNTLLNFFVSLCVGGLAGFGLAFLLEYFDHTLKVPEDVGKMLDLPFIGAIEDLTEKGLPDLKTLAASPSSPPPFEILKGNLKTLASETRTRIFSVCASSDDEGASTIAFNLAASLTKDKGQRVLLVDGNVREPALHSLFNLPMAPGLSDLVLDGADIRQTPRETAIPNLFVLTCGTIPANPIGLFESPRLGEFVATVRADFNWIIVDGAPVNAYPDTAALASKVDATILVVQAETKRAEVALQAKERLEKGGGSILGVVLNRRRFIIPEAIYRRL